MGRLWEDGFDHYGASLDRMLDGSYATATNDNTLSTAQFVTGTRSFLCNGNTGGGGSAVFKGLRKVLPTAKDKLGAAARFYFPSLPGQPYANNIFQFISGVSTKSQLDFIVDTNGAIRIVRGERTHSTDGRNLVEGTLIATTDPILTAAAWNHIEVQAYIHDSAGWVRIAVNGVHRYEGTGLDTKHDSSNVASVGQSRSFNQSSGTFYMDDYYIYDFTGTSSTDTDFCPPTDGNGKATGYIGELQVWPLFPNGDTAEADWSKSTGSVGYDLIDDPTPNDATYIYSSAADDLSEFALQDLPEEITYVRGLGIHARMSKNDSGAAMVQLGMKSDTSTDDATERPLTTAPTYWRDMINVDPDSSARWTRASLNAAWLRLTRSA